MFSAEPDQRMMICSEFAARSIGSCIDQTNRLMALDLVANDLIDQEETIIKNPISNKERIDRTHPERLVKILQDSGCITKVQNSKLSQIVNTEDVSKGTPKNISLETNLSAKTLDLLKSAQNKEEFLQKSSTTYGIYLSNTRVDTNTVKNVQNNIVQPQMSEIYDSYKREPRTIKEKITKAVKSVLAFCRVISKDRDVKKAIENLRVAANNHASKAAENKSVNRKVSQREL